MNLQQLHSGVAIDWAGDRAAVRSVTAAGGAHCFAHGCRVEVLAVEPLETALDTKAGAFVFRDGQLIGQARDGPLVISRYRIRVYGSDVVHEAFDEFARIYDLPLNGTFTRSEKETLESSRMFSKVIAHPARTPGRREDIAYIPYTRSRGFERDLIETLGLQAGARVLDIGCGDGWFSLLMSEAGMDAWACDLMPPSALPPEVLQSVHYFTADLFEMPPPAEKFDLLYMRNITVEHDEKSFGEPWKRMFSSLREYLSESGHVYWDMLSNPFKIEGLDSRLFEFFEHRHYRCCGTTAVILGRHPFVDHRARVTYATDRDLPFAACCDWLQNYEEADCLTYLKALNVAVDDLLRRTRYAFGGSLAIMLPTDHALGLDDTLDQMLFDYYGYFKRYDPSRLDASFDGVIWCWRQAVDDVRSRCPRATIVDLTPQSLVDSCLNPNHWLVNKDKDIAACSLFLRERLRMLESRMKNPPSRPRQLLSRLKRAIKGKLKRP